MNMNDINKLKQFFNESKNIVFLSHRNPDGDAIGSTLALSKFFSKLGHQTQVILPDGIPDFLNWMPGVTTVLRYDYQNNQSKKAIQEADVIFILDFNAMHRLGADMEKGMEIYNGPYIMIDHHQEPDPIAMVTYSDTQISSTCQMVYHFIENYGGIDLIDADIATCIYTGIMTDTGSFRFPLTTSTTHQIVASLIDKGAKNSDIHNQVFSNNSFSRLQLLGKALTNLKVLPDLHTAYITLSLEELKQYHYEKGDTEGIVNYALSLKGIVFAAIFIESDDAKMIKISFRSKGKFSVNQFSRKYFNGGGHDNAAGGRTELTLQETVQQFLTIVPNYQQELALSYEN